MNIADIIHTGAFCVDVLGYGKIHNDYLKNPTSVTTKKLLETFGIKVTCGTRPCPVMNILLFFTIMLEAWSEDMVITVEKVCYCCETIKLKIQKVVLWNVEVTNDGEGNTTVNAVEYPDPSTKYPNGVVMTRYMNAPIIKTEECWRVHPDPFERTLSGVLKRKGWGYSVRNTTYPINLHGIEKLLASECIRKKGQKRPATRPSWMN